MRRRILITALLAAACGPDYDYPYGDGNGNQIVFGIEQSAQGVSADYDFIGLEGHGGSVAAAFRDGDGEGACWFENLASRLGKPHVDNGTALWTGGTLPTDGLLIQANQAAPTTQATAGWATTDTISFWAEGFAMPPIGRVTMRAPLVELTINSIAPAPDAANAIAITSKTEVAVTWTPPAENTSSSVMVTLETDRANVRCFDNAKTGSSIVPAKWIAQLFPDDGTDAGTSSITGKLTIATHRQITMLEPGDWIVYAVATTVQRDIAFTGTR